MVVILSIVAFLLGISVGTGHTADQFITIGTCGPGGYWFQSGAVLADLMNKNIQGVTANAQATACAVHNLGALNKKEMELGMSVNYLSYQAYTGTGAYKDKGIFNISALTSWYRNYLLVFTLDEKIASFADFKGKRIIIGGAGSATEKTATELLKACGLEQNKDYTPIKANLEPGIELMKGRQADVQMWLMPTKNAALLSLIETHDTYFISVPKEGGEKFCEALKPSFRLVDIPNGTYRTQKKSLKAASHMVDLLVIPDLSEDIVYKIVKTLFENLDTFHSSLGATAKDLNRDDALSGVTVPLHPGALKYYKEQKFPGLDDYLEVAGNAMKVREESRKK